MERVSGVPPSRQFFIQCETCGQYTISEKTAQEFLTQKLRKRLEKAFSEGAHGAILRFLDGCPNCKPNNLAAKVELLAFRKTVH